MSYYFSKILNCSFEEAVRLTTEALQKAGFGIISQIDVKETFKTKLEIDFRNYRILGACNPRLAREALEIEDKVGTMLPCNVVIQDVGGGGIEVAAIDLLASMQAIENIRLQNLAKQVQAMLRDVINSLS